MSLKSGKLVERMFASGVLKGNFLMSNKKQDMEEHWDVATKIKFDVKGMKSIFRNGKKDENFHWIELRNVHGKKGWLYSGYSQFLVFETEDYWVICDRLHVRNLVIANTEKVYVDKPQDALYKLYSRKDREDLMTLVKTMDLMAIATLIVKKHDL